MPMVWARPLEMPAAFSSSRVNPLEYNGILDSLNRTKLLQ
jgi:hypothetical protein